MKSIYWFRNDLRVIDNLPLNKAIESSDEILFVYVQDVKSFKDTEWRFPAWVLTESYIYPKASMLCKRSLVITDIP